jgi:hypothetical protein
MQQFSFFRISGKPACEGWGHYRTQGNERPGRPGVCLTMRRPDVTYKMLLDHKDTASTNTVEQNNSD